MTRYCFRLSVSRLLHSREINVTFNSERNWVSHAPDCGGDSCKWVSCRATNPRPIPYIPEANPGSGSATDNSERHSISGTSSELRSGDETRQPVKFSWIKTSMRQRLYFLWNLWIYYIMKNNFSKIELSRIKIYSYVIKSSYRICVLSKILFE